MSLSKNAFACIGWKLYWGDRFAGAKDHAMLESLATECDNSAPGWVTQEYLFKARDSYHGAKRRLDAKLKG